MAASSGDLSFSFSFFRFVSKQRSVSTSKIDASLGSGGLGKVVICCQSMDEAGLPRSLNRREPWKFTEDENIEWSVTRRSWSAYGRARSS